MILSDEALHVTPVHATAPHGSEVVSGQPVTTPLHDAPLVAVYSATSAAFSPVLTTHADGKAINSKSSSTTAAARVCASCVVMALEATAGHASFATPGEGPRLRTDAEHAASTPRHFPDIASRS
jgi:hypothetical protein